MTAATGDLIQRGLAAFRAGEFAEAERLFKRALRANPRDVGALNLLGALMLQGKKFNQAEQYIRAALALNASAASYHNHGLALKALRRPLEAFEQFGRALALDPSNAETWNNRGTVLNDVNRPQQAIADFDQAIARNGGYTEAFCNKGHSLTKLRRYEEALAAYDRALALQPHLAEAWLDRAHLFFELRRYDEAFLAYDKAWSLQPDLPYVEGYRLHVKMHRCDWSDLGAERADLTAGIRQRRPVCEPTIALSMPTTPADQLAVARVYSGGGAVPKAARLWCGQIYSHERIRVAYLSADFHDHPVAPLLVGLIEHHDRARFEPIAVSVGPDDGSDMRARLKAAFGEFIDARGASDLDLAQGLLDRKVDIAVDLMGFTAGARRAILDYRAVPVQVNYLGYSATTGADTIDYIIADRFVIPEEERAHYSEQVVYLPDCFMVQNRNRAMAERTPTRAEAGLPETGVVFCSFNNSFKFTPEMFDVWMRLLCEVEGSVLWLSTPNATAAANLRAEAERRQVRGDRLIFAPRVKLAADHLARHRLADLFLDTLPYNAHASAGDALWAGLPVVTCSGATFAGRIAGSLLRAAGLSELIASTIPDYEALALTLARDPAKLSSLKAKLRTQRGTAPLFDTARTARHIEAAFAQMRERQRRGLRAKGFAVQP